MYMQNTHPVLAVLVAAVGLRAYQLQHLTTMQQNLERFYRSVTLRQTLLSQSLLQEKHLLNWSLRIVFSIQYWDTCRFRDIPNYAQGRYQAKVRSQPSRTERNASAFRQIQCCHIFIRFHQYRIKLFVNTYVTIISIQV